MSLLQISLIALLDEVDQQFLVNNLFACSCVKPVHGPIVEINGVHNFMVKTE